MYGDIWYSGGSVPDLQDEFCKSTIKLAHNLPEQEGLVNDRERIEQIRSNSIFVIEMPEFKTLIYEWVKIANEEKGWNFDLTGIQNLQLSEYQTSQKYSWHIDIKPEEVPCRKLSFNVVLNDGFEGGDFQFSWGSPSAKYKKRIIEEPQSKIVGRMIVFPSYYYHRVKPVTKGIRYSLTGWITGPPFR